MTTPADVAKTFLTALRERDAGALAGCLGANIAFRALTPLGIRAERGAADAMSVLREWFLAPPEAQVEWSCVEPVGNRVRIGYRVRWLDTEGSRWVFEQHAYALVAGSTIEELDLVCSGDHALAPS
jgi:hypothetical protein